MANGRRRQERDQERILRQIRELGVEPTGSIVGIEKEGLRITPAGRELGTGAIVMTPEAARLAITDAGEGPLNLTTKEIEKFERRAREQTSRAGRRSSNPSPRRIF